MSYIGVALIVISLLILLIALTMEYAIMKKQGSEDDKRTMIGSMIGYAVIFTFMTIAFGLAVVSNSCSEGGGGGGMGIGDIAKLAPLFLA